MSYLNYPRIHFSGTFQADPSTINNTPNNFDPLIYPTPNELEKVELYWNPRGKGGLSLMDDCVVTQVDYEDGTSATTSAEDSIIGQPVKAVYSPSFPLQSALVDLDPMQQNVSEIWALTLQIGGDDANLTGSVPNVAFTGIWGQCQGPNAPHSSISGSAVFQVKMNNVVQTGDASSSRFLNYFAAHPTDFLSLNVNTNAHNNSPQLYRFADSTFEKMRKASTPVPESVILKMAPMRKLFQNSSSENGYPVAPGDIPTEEFMKYMLQQYLTPEEYNANIATILDVTPLPYTNSTYDFLLGMITGTVGPASTSDPVYFVPSRMMVPTSGSRAYYAPFSIDGNGITLNLGNSLPTNTPGNDIYQDVLGELWLVAFPNGNISLQNAERLEQITYDGTDFLAKTAGFFTSGLGSDWRGTPLGILSVNVNDITSTESIILAEDPQGLYLRADQFVYRMNPGYDTTPSFPRGSTNTVQVHATQFGNPVPDGTEISLTVMTEDEALKYTAGTLGTSGTKGLENLSTDPENLSFPATASTQNGVAVFNMSGTNPGNPRKYVDGQVYFLKYNFVGNEITKDVNDIISVMLYGQEIEEDAQLLLAKFGRLYKIMDFLTDRQQQINMRNMIKTLLERPMEELNHMPVTRDLSEAGKQKVVDWVNALNNS